MKTPLWIRRYVDRLLAEEAEQEALAGAIGFGIVPPTPEEIADEQWRRFYVGMQAAGYFAPEGCP